MKYIGIPYCPYCKKPVNIVRIWTLKKEGEYMCPRCKGFSNIYLSPLVYVLAAISIGSGFLTYFFSRYVSEDISLTTPIKVIIPFLIFFIGTQFMVYLEKPVVRRVRKGTDGKFYNEVGKQVRISNGRIVGAKKTQPKKPVKEFDYFDKVEKKLDVKDEDKMYEKMAKSVPLNNSTDDLKMSTDDKKKKGFDDLFDTYK